MLPLTYTISAGVEEPSIRLDQTSSNDTAARYFALLYRATIDDEQLTTDRPTIESGIPTAPVGELELLVRASDVKAGGNVVYDRKRHNILLTRTIYGKTVDGTCNDKCANKVVTTSMTVTRDVTDLESAELVIQNFFRISFTRALAVDMLIAQL